ncbi:MAG: hypothetical protein UW30_C0008G0039 [Candidatus Giovannonibacteria bacterium GW2011_GWA2_44_13b]|uniref:PD-(D/E)XK endonuclease-like domain-containing protein n=2 Tax=Candidatus Giovannoniibacteriota TaxID=1752738 RepID=A0A0G1H3Q5_9BACT|nr:MAG: hypothetical protein UW30_C0008G0039 [Candidatus Giovannonibacteria bacterium GW2011_GWA2_44_13b]OGF82689.1 MAG: hypothetical protein A2924_00800 [Candidatus Giovannonibacteria bacterium RIFCSPLOWO2_01_FULL_44_16]
MWYKDAEQFMKSAGHEVDGVWYPRVTKILEVKAKPGIDMFLKEMESYSAAESVKIKSAEEGTRVHEVLQKTAVGEPIEVDEDLLPVRDAFLEFNKTANIVFHPDYIERPIWSAFHKFSGTIDGIATIGGKFGVLDIKTSTGFFPEYNLQTAAYVLALQEPSVKKALALPQDIQTRWILRADQVKTCLRCNATLRAKGGRNKIRNGKNGAEPHCGESHEEHYWGPTKGIIELREFPYYIRDIKAFLAAKTLWEWDNDYWLRQIGYL